MSQPALDATATAYRRKTCAKLILFFILMLIVWLQPKVEKWLEDRNAGGAGDSDIVAKHDSISAGTTQSPSNRSNVVIKDVEDPVVAEVDRPDSTVSSINVAPDPAGSRAETEKPKATTSKSSKKIETDKAKVTKSDVKNNSNSDLVRMDHDTGAKQRTAGDESNGLKNSTATLPRTSTTSSDKSLTKDTPALGELREIRNNVFESTAGLRYVPGSADGHRLKHVMQHSKDDLSKPKHGVFEGDRDQILAVIDEAYEKTKKGGKDVRKSDQAGRTVYLVNLGRKIGYVGGSSGERSSNPECRYVQLVLEDENVVITAYPTKSF